MTPKRLCPDPSRLQALFDGTLPKEARRALSEHLETCSECQQTVERAISAHGLRIPPAQELDEAMGAVESALQRVMEELVGSPRSKITLSESELDAATSSFDFLEPPRQPEHLGRIAHYEISEIIGRGGMGVVFKALDEKLQRTVAIKVLAPRLAANEPARKRFLREARTAAAIHNPHVVTIHAIEEFCSIPYLVMEYVSGQSLQARLDGNGPLDEREVLRIGRHVAVGLAAAHAKGLIHRDIKPANILLDTNGRAKISDFGLARAVDDGSITHLGVVAGTPQYMAPEQARGERSDHRADLFSLGSVLYAMCSGQAPYSGSNVLAILRRICDEAPRPVQELNPNVPNWLAKLIVDLQAKDPDKRIQSAADVAALLVKGNGNKPSSPAMPIVTPADSGRSSAIRRRRQPNPSALVLACSAVLAVAVACGLLIWSNAAAPNAPSSPVADITPTGPDGTSSPSVAESNRKAPVDVAASRAPVHSSPAISSPVVERPPRVLFVLPSRDIYAPDFVPVASFLKQAGMKLQVASSSFRAAVPNLTAHGEPVRPSLLVDQARSDDFDAVIFCGGAAVIDEYAGDGPYAAAARRLISDMLAANKYVAGLCTGPVVLAEAGVLRGVRATCFEYGNPPGVCIKRLKAAGAEWVDEPVVISGAIVTGRDPDDVQEFAYALKQLLQR